MSRIGKLPIAVPAGVTVSVVDGVVKVKGPRGELTQSLATGVTLQQDGTTLQVLRADDGRQTRANHGLTRALVSNMVGGVTKGFERRLDIQGVGFKGELKGKSVVLSLGYSHEVNFEVPKGVTVTSPKQTEIIVEGIDQQQVGQVAANIREWRAPEPYKGKGIRYKDEYIFRKEGKKK